MPSVWVGLSMSDPFDGKTPEKCMDLNCCCVHCDFHSAVWILCKMKKVQYEKRLCCTQMNNKFKQLNTFPKRCDSMPYFLPKEKSWNYLLFKFTVMLSLNSTPVSYSYVFNTTLRQKWGNSAVSCLHNFTKFGVIFFLHKCAAGVLFNFPVSEVESCAMTQVFVSLWGCWGSGSINMTDLIYPSRIQRGPRCKEWSFNSSTVSAKAQIIELCNVAAGDSDVWKTICI